jgi:DmsE family decaheme c-type cytochrome
MVVLKSAAQSQTQATSKKAASKLQSTRSSDIDPSQYAGPEACKDCHDVIYKDFETTAHRKTLDTRRKPAELGCESCHGPGAEHIQGGGDLEKIVRFKTLSATGINERCMTCHRSGREHANFERSPHATSDVSCISCHATHHPPKREHLLNASEPTLCYKCHLGTRPEFARPFRHRVNEGLLRCSDCHNPHGGFLTRQLRTTAAQDAVCFKCHLEKEGPFVFEHPVTKTEGCVACHSPHGSSNPRLLKRAQVNLVCLECHTLTVDSPAPGIPSFHNQAQKYQACTLCHAAIHGSNFSHVFFR